jgi:hypothetical protein
MRSALCDAVAKCHTRRLRTAVAAAPLPAALVTILVALAPFALARVGGAIGSDLADGVAAGGVADALVIGPALAAAVAGAALAVSLPGRSALGHQVAAGPGSNLATVVAGLLVPALIGTVVVLPQVLSLCLALGGRLPGGWIAGAALACATIAAVPAGAIVAEATLAAVRGRRRPSLVVGAGALVWAMVGLAAGTAALGPLAPVGAALRGSGSAWLALAVACSAALVLASGWVVLAARRPDQRARTPKPRRPIVHGGRSSIPLAVAVLLARRADVRLATVGALGFGAAGIAIAVVAAAPAPTPFLLGTTTALLGSILCSLAVCGVLLGGQWLWIGAPRDPLLVGMTASFVGLTGSALPVVAVGLGATAVSGASWRTLGVVAAFVVLGSAAALQAGALVPWRSDGVGDQLTTFAALAAIAIATSLAIGLVAPRLVALGLPDASVVVFVCGAWLGFACHALGRRLAAVA